MLFWSSLVTWIYESFIFFICRFECNKIINFNQMNVFIMKFLTIFLFLVVLNIGDSEELNVKVAIVGTNDLHGAAFPTRLYRVDTN